MKILQSWLKDYIAFDLSPEELADKLAMSGTAVEDILYGLDEKVIVAEILKIEPHPNADRLRLTTVETGTGSKIVVCGAPNIEVGQKVPLAQLGTILPGGEIKKANIRGVDSEGMLCAADELGIGEDHAGVYVLPSDYINGKPLREYLSSDAVFDLEITPNRGDCLSHLGIAREIAAILDKKTIQAEHKWPKEETIKCPFELEVKLEADEICTRYYGIGIMGVTVKNAPDFIASRLEKLGSKSINNIVDITNYLLLAIGQPMHAFDANKIEGGKIIVRFAKEGEEVVTLDNVKRSLVSTDLVIADTKKVIAVAGVMGCKNSEVDQQTKNIFLEVAEFDPRSVRKTAKRLSLQTDASYRYERGIDRAAISEAQNLAVPMIIESAGGKYTSGVVFINGTRPYEELPIKIEYQKINRLLGIDLSENKIELLLQRVGFKTNDGIGYIPTWRNDISIWQDLAEEVGRIYDYSNIQPLSLPKTTAPVKSAYYQKAYIKSLLTGLGFNEVINYPFMSEADLAAAQVEAKDLVELANPIQIENKYLRKSLAPGLLKAIAKNPSFDPVTIFEIGEVFGSKNEITNISIATSGNSRRQMSSDQSFVDFIMETMAGAGKITCRKLFGEYAIYCGGKVVALVCDNRLFVKQTPGGRAFIGKPVEAPAYPGAKLSFLIEDKIEDRAWMGELIRITSNELLEPKEKAKKKIRKTTNR